MNLPVPVNPIGEDERPARLAEAFIVTRKSAHTRAAYASDIIGSWLRWCRVAKVAPLAARHADVQRWLSWRRELGDAESTLARRLAAVSSWYRWLLREEQVAKNPADLHQEERPRASRDHLGSIALTDRQLDAMLAAADADGPRTSAIVALLANSGIRVGELIAANVEDIKEHQGHLVLVVMGKGARQRNVPVPPSVYVKIDAYLVSRGDCSRLPDRKGYSGAAPLVMTSTGRRMSRLQVRRDLKRVARAAGLSESLVAQISPHVTRHSYATSLIEDGEPIREVQRALGHASTATTERYDHSALALDRHPTYKRATQLAKAHRKNESQAEDEA